MLKHIQSTYTGLVNYHFNIENYLDCLEWTSSGLTYIKNQDNRGRNQGGRGNNGERNNGGGQSNGGCYKDDKRKFEEAKKKVVATIEQAETKAKKIADAAQEKEEQKKVKFCHFITKNLIS